MYLKRVYKEVALRALNRGVAWSGYLAGDRVAPEKVPKFGRKVFVQTAAELEVAHQEVLGACNPDSGFRIAYYVEVAEPVRYNRGHHAAW